MLIYGLFWKIGRLVKCEYVRRMDDKDCSLYRRFTMLQDYAILYLCRFLPKES